MKHVTLHMIGNAHLDPVWLWRWQEDFQASKATFRAVLDLLREDDLILHCYEAHRVATEATICLTAWGRSFSASFAPCEIKTFRVPRDPSQPVQETNFIEWSL